MDNINILYDLCEVISDELEIANDKIKQAGGKLSAGDVDYIDKLTHALKSIKTTIAMTEAEDDYSNADGRMSYDGGMSYARNRDDGRNSYARNNRGRGSRAKRDSMGRYSSRGYSRDGGGIKEMLEEAMEEAQTEREREAIRRAIKDLER